ncbi:RNA-directed DNA polymerase, eukaryota [Tanacetum coccineum]
MPGYLNGRLKTLYYLRKLTLLKIVLGASPIYYMSIFKVPKVSVKDYWNLSVFHRLFALNWNKEMLVDNKLGELSSVSASFRRDVRDGAERQQWDDLSSIMNSVVLSSSKDRWTCDLSGDGEFKVKVIRNFIDDLFLPSSDVATRWVKFIPIKVNVFSWRARRDRLPTRVNLSRRGVLLDSHLCPLCNAAMEDVQHVFFRCDVARVVLRKICRWWDLDWQEICSFSDWDAWFLSFRLSSRLKSILEGVFYVAWWRIWRLRNQLVFDASPPNRSTIFDDIWQEIEALAAVVSSVAIDVETSTVIDLATAMMGGGRDGIVVVVLKPKEKEGVWK